MTGVVRAFGEERDPRILTTGKGVPRKILHNAVEHLGYAKPWRGVVRWNEFAQRAMCWGRPPRDDGRFGSGEWTPAEWSDEHTAIAHSWLATKALDLPASVVGHAAMMVARFDWNRFNPVRDWMAGLSWDPGARLADDWLVRFAGCEDNSAVRDAGRMWLVSSVARVMTPGCQVDHMLILEGGQGLGKTRLVRSLCGQPEWFSATPIQVGSKDAYQQIQGVQVYLLDEFDRLVSGYHASAIKDFITQTDDRFRVPYGTQPERFPRQCVFIGATNESAYLEDATGNRRYWPVRCGVTGELDYRGLHEARAQLWAHAFALWQGGAQWWPTGDQTMAFRTEQAERESEDPWRTPVLSWMRKGQTGMVLAGVDIERITTHTVLEKALTLGAKDQTKQAARRVAGILRQGGFRETRPRADNPDRLRFWRAEESETPASAPTEAGA